MFIGHYSAALAASAAEPRARLWVYIAGCQLLDIAWSALVMAGIEKLRIDPQLPGNALDLYSMPYTHSLPAALLWSAIAAALARGLLRLPWRAAVIVALTVFSHWVLDLLVHRPDLELWFGGPKAGLGLWNRPLAEMALEVGLVAVAGAAWSARRRARGRGALAPVLFIAFLVAVQVIGAATPAAADPAALGRTALIVYLAIVAVAWFVDRSERASEANAEYGLRRP
jgi:hypothetical protein